MGGVMQNPKEKSDKFNSGGGWSVSAIIWAVLAATAVMGICGFAPLWFPEKWGWGKDEMSILERMKFAAYVVGGGLVLWQLQISNRRSTALEKTAALGEKGNITERFKNAIEHLGSESESIRMGGIYGLYHVVQESRGYADTVLKILCAHAKSIIAEPGYTEKEKPSSEIAAILDVLFPIIPDDENQKIEILFEKVDISGWHLQGADVKFRHIKHVHGSEVNLSRANLQQANLLGAKLHKVKLLNAYLAKANLVTAHLWDADLEEANLEEANLENAYLFGANLENANLEEANLENAYLEGAKLHGANLHNVNLERADLENANLEGADLENANLEGADLEEANLKGADLENANLERAKLENANLEGANLEGANLEGADLENANLERADLSGANVTTEQLLQVKTLHEAQLDDHIREEILRRKPELLGLPADSPDEEE